MRSEAEAEIFISGASRIYVIVSSILYFYLLTLPRVADSASGSNQAAFNFLRSHIKILPLLFILRKYSI